MTYLLDTNICIYIIKKKLASVVNIIRSKQPEDIGISTVTIAELAHGIAKSLHPLRNRLALLEFLVPFHVLDFDQAAALRYGEIRTSLESRAAPIGRMDLLLAAQAKSQDAILVTNNEKEFRRIDGLRVENWAAV
jgi:tRNA(fMet)-specific endonuclease VapC